jgi:hypothetical protein
MKELTTFIKTNMIRLLIILFGIISIPTLLLIVMAILSPMELLIPTNADGSTFSYRSAPVLYDENGHEIEKEQVNYLPARVPFIEKLGILDGSSKIQVTAFDIMIGRLPQTDYWQSLRRPYQKKNLLAKLDIPYHPYDIKIKDIENKDHYMTTIEILETGEEVQLPYEDLISEFSRYKLGTFEFVKANPDNQTITLDANGYKIQGIEHLYFYLGTDPVKAKAIKKWIGLILVFVVLGMTYLIILIKRRKKKT